MKKEQQTVCEVHSHPDTLTHTLTNCIWVTVHPTSSIYSQVEGVSANNHEYFHVLDIFKNEREMLLGIPLRRLHQHPPRIHLVIMIHQHGRFLHLASEKPRTVPHDVFRLHMFQCEGQLLHFYLFLL